ncbi:MAG: hypothetical protein FJ110_04880 [Deltaproteobacteria bacterium]|nr:hypothetical protein [Deltaproteobacteria bacterium]
MEHQDIKEENRRIRFLRFLVDLSILSIQESDCTLEEASEMVEEARRAALNLFPGKELAFELIYRPRFQRVIEARFGLPLTPTLSPQAGL